MYPISAKKRKKEKNKIVYPNSFSFSFFEKVQIPKFTPKRDNVSKVLSKKKKTTTTTIFEMEVKGFNEFDSGTEPNQD